VKDKYKPAFVPFLLEGVAGKTELNQADGIHPNEKGYEQILSLIYPKVKELL
jgi:acyl-CoA thioesterase-1